MDATGNPTKRDCTLQENASSCVCPHTAGALTAAQLPPVCDAATETQRVAAKNYPTVRELLLAHKMGRQGIASSICPVHVADNATSDDPLYGYRPAVASIVDRVKTVLSNQCLPQPIAARPDGTIDCAIFLQVPGGSAGWSGSCLHPQCPKSAGLEVPAAQGAPELLRGPRERVPARGS